MSTKGLIADKRVKLVTLNDAGKADTLTLNDGWTFEGSAGPFKLDNVDHGHKIVKAATNPNAPSGRAPKAPKAPRAALDYSKPYEGPPTPSPAVLDKIQPVRNIPQVWIYRSILFDPVINAEVTGWGTSTQERSPEAIDKATRDALAPYLLRKGGDPARAEVKTFRWTTEHEKEARKLNESGCPWPGRLTV